MDLTELIERLNDHVRYTYMPAHVRLLMEEAAARLTSLSDVLERGVDMASQGRTEHLCGDALTRTAEGGE